MHGVMASADFAWHLRHDIDGPLLVIVQVFVAPRGQTVDSRDHQFLHGVFNQIHIPTAHPSGHHQIPISPLLAGLSQKTGPGTPTQALVIVEVRRKAPPK